MNLLPFQIEMASQILSEKLGLWIVAPGLGLLKVVQQCVIEIERACRSKNTLFLFLNTNTQQPISEKFLSYNFEKFKLINSDYSSEQRYDNFFI